jgi:hypothetical protein
MEAAVEGSIIRIPIFFLAFLQLVLAVGQQFD